MKHGDFSQLAEAYDQYRPDYSPNVLEAVLGLLDRDISECNFADVGAGTGIWTRMLAAMNPKLVNAIEPNEEMRSHGSAHSVANIEWRDGSGEHTNLADQSVDLVSMASSFHWVDFEKGTEEFHRILKPNGLFVALWNPRFIDNNPILKDIENYLYVLEPNMKRVSSGSSGMTSTIFDKLTESPLFDNVLYLEGRHKKHFTTEQYIGVWESVNDIQVQLGKEKFGLFLDFIKEKIGNKGIIAEYKTRAWVSRKKS
ncbi:class I SAM-dependent methyltransferase [Agarivorans sp. TSD2052]|uniref:class I SAM-dependent methyltransferase n=1 Tax=Agarivorans sp. TSD2052 TaxID=2937286 RepID=UPI00200C8554|nr:class I SAM-dependent methyltransferase [Agarivorans sp. TSD2052]UPW20175.1 class I SAM-dependent methyltransferase [Agarivorans sp. TSD2052]